MRSDGTSDLLMEEPAEVEVEGRDRGGHVPEAAITVEGVAVAVSGSASAPTGFR